MTWAQAVKDKFGFDPEHLHLSSNVWIFQTFKKSDYNLKNDHNLLSRLDKITKELCSTEKNTVHPPQSTQIIMPKGCIQQEKKYNILTLAGMNEMAKRSTDDTDTHNTHHGIGTGTTAETINDTTLETEIGRIEIGTRAVVNQTERYGSVFDSNDIDNPPQDITEAGIFTADANGILIMRVTNVAIALPAGLQLAIQTNVTHQNGTEI